MKHVVTLQVSGMHCDHCLHAVREALASVPGARVEDVRIGSATVLVDDELADVASLIDAVDDAGYAAAESQR